MANKMINVVLSRGRAYKCVPCAYVENKSRMEKHFYTSHVAEYQVPYMCKPCEYRTGDAGKFARHQQSPSHLEKVPPTDVLLEATAYQVSSVPKTMVVGEDVLRLSREESSQHWLSTAAEETAPVVEDLRVQLLTSEPMCVTPPQEPLASGENPTEQVTQNTDVGVNTDAVTPEGYELIKQMNSQLVVISEYMSKTFGQLYEYIEKVSAMNTRQEAMIQRLEGRLNESEERERRLRAERERELERERRLREERARERDGRRARDYRR